MATSRLDILIAAKDQASRELRKIESNVDALGGVAGTATRALGALGVAFGAVQMGRFAVDAAQAAAQASSVEDSFRSLAGTAADEMLSSMQRMSAGMISNTDLMLSANKAMMLGVADTADEMSRLLEIAAERGQAMGLTTAQAFNDIVTGIGRQSAMILDNLGIVVDTEKAFEDYAAILGKTADALTDAEKKQAFLNASISESDGTLDATIDQYQRLNVALQDLKISFGELAGPSITNVVGGTAGMFDRMREQLDAFERGGVRALNETILQQKEIMRGEILQPYDAALMNTYRSLGMVKDATEALSQSTEDYATIAGGGFLLNMPEMIPLSETSEFADEIERAARGIEQFAYSQGYSVGGAATEYAKATQRLSEWVDLQQQMGRDGGTIMNLLREQASRITDELRNMSVAGVTAGENIKGGMISASVGVSILSSNLADALGKLGAMGGAISDARTAFDETFGAGATSKMGVLNDGLAEAGEIGFRLERIYSPSGSIATGISSLAGKVQSLFGVGGSTAGINADDLLPRADAVDENARRLADIAINGFKGQDWMSEFAAEAPNIFAQLQDSGDVRATAAQLLNDFQDGLLNGTDVLIDREAAKEQVRRMIMGEQSTAELANSIASELSSEMGIAMQSAQGAAAAILGGNAGGEEIIAGLRGNQSKFEAAGRDGGKWYGQSFLDVFGGSVPSGVITTLANLVTPAVQANIDTRSSRAGAVG